MSRHFRQLLILTSLASITIALIAWYWSVNDSPDAPPPTHHKPVSPRFSTVKTRAKRLAKDHSRLRTANIDVNARLRALYEKYPELTVELHEPRPELVSRFKKLFPNPSNPNFGDASNFEPMILGISPWDEAAAARFLDKNADRLTELISLIEVFEDFEKIQFNGLNEAQRLLSISYGLNLKLGKLERAQELYTSAQKLIDREVNANLILVSHSIALSLSLNSYNLQLIAEQPDLVAQLESAPHSTPTFSQTIQGEFTGSIKMVYDLAQRDHNGELYFDISTDSNDLDAGSITENHIPLEIIENSLARQFIENIRYFEKLEESDTSISEEEIAQELNDRLAKSSDFTAVDKQLAELTFTGLGYYFDALKDAQQLQKVNTIAIEISYAQSHGTEWIGELPIDHKTGKSIIWDKENNLLETGIEGNNATIAIPVIE